MRNRSRKAELRRSGLAAAAMVVLVSIAPSGSRAATSAPTPASLTNCGGKVAADPGAKAAGTPNLLDYRFSCDGPISAYTVIVDQWGDRGGSLDDYNPSPSVFQNDGVTPSPTESITCEGTTPSNGINCNFGPAGSLSAGYVAAGSVDPVAAYCKHLPTTASGKTARPGTPAIPQAVVQLVVTDATGAQDGPFNLGPVKRCAAVPNVVPTPRRKHKKAKSRARR